MIIERIVQLLLAEPSVSALVGTRVFPVMLPDASSFPAVVVTKATGLGSYDLDGDAGIEEARVQIDCYSDQGAASVIALKTAVRRFLSGYRSTTPSGEDGPACAIQTCLCINDSDMTEPATERAGPKLRRRMLEFSIWNREI